MPGLKGGRFRPLNRLSGRSALRPESFGTRDGGRSRWQSYCKFRFWRLGFCFLTRVGGGGVALAPWSRGPWQAAGRTIASSRAWKSSFVIRHPPPPVRGRLVIPPRPIILHVDSHHEDNTWQNGSRRPSSTPAAACAAVAAAAARRGRVAARRAARGGAGAAAGREQEQQQQEKEKRWCGVAGGCPGCIVAGVHLADLVSSRPTNAQGYAQPV
jgi:hypothetical protein